MAIRDLFKKTHDHYQVIKDKVNALKKSREEEPPHPHHKKEEPSIQRMEISASAGTMAKFISIAILLLLVVGFLYKIADILVIFFVSLLLAAALDPLVDGLERRRIPRALGVVIVYVITLLFLGIFISNIAPVMASELVQLAGKAQGFITNIAAGKIDLPNWMLWLKPSLQKLFAGLNVSQIGDYKDILLGAASQLSNVAGNVFNAIIFIFNGFFNAILIFVLTFMMIVDEHGIDHFILSLFPSKHAEYINEKSHLLKQKMGGWLRGQVILCLVVGALVYIGLLIMSFFTGGFHYAATISMIAGLLEIIPYAGPILAWIIALPIVANQSFGLILWMTALMYLVQLLENNLIVPLVMNKAVGISPIFIMLAVLIGFEFLGILGVLLAVPVATACAVFLKDYAEKDK